MHTLIVLPIINVQLDMSNQVHQCSKVYGKLMYCSFVAGPFTTLYYNSFTDSVV